MIHQPTRFIHGQALHPDSLNAILDTLRRITPIQGPGISLSQSPNGIVISATAKNAKPVTEKTAGSLLPLTIQKFVYEEPMPDGTTQEIIKYGIYIPGETTASLISAEPQDDTSEITTFKTLPLLVDGYDPVDEEHPFWRDITYHLLNPGASILGIEITPTEDDKCQIDIAFKQSSSPIPYSTDQGDTSDGWFLPLARILFADDVISSIEQFNYGPLHETTIPGTCRLHKTTDNVINLGSKKVNWTPVESGEELSPSTRYFLISLFKTQLQFVGQGGTNTSSGVYYRSKASWISYDTLIELRPLAFANFGSIIS